MCRACRTAVDERGMDETGGGSYGSADQFLPPSASLFRYALVILQRFGVSFYHLAATAGERPGR